MKNEFDIEALNAKFAGHTAGYLVEWTLAEITAPNFILASSMSVESQVLTDMFLQRDKTTRIVMIDSGRLNQETYDILDWTRKRYGVNIEIVFPDSGDVEEMVRKDGANLFFDSVAKRKLCCEIRKVLPLRRKLSGLRAWITGLKRSDSALRGNIAKIEWDEQFSLIKINPLADWTDEDIWKYIKDNEITPNALYERGYRSIGCEPCTRATGEGEDVRAGRWWWEPRSNSECGLHMAGGKLVRSKKEDAG